MNEDCILTLGGYTLVKSDVARLLAEETIRRNEKRNRFTHTGRNGGVDGNKIQLFGEDHIRPIEC